LENTFIQHTKRQKNYNNTKEFKGNDYIKQIIFYKTQYSAPDDYDEEVLKGLKKCKVVSNYKIENGNISI